jgi:hypothetical protein
LIALGVARRVSMLTAIDFDDEAMFVTHKISDERPDRRLAPKADAFQSMRAKRRPKVPFCFGQVFAQSFGVAAMNRRNRPMSNTPLPNRVAGRPPPQGGRWSVLVARH